MGQAIQLSIDEAKYNRDASATSKYTKQKAMLIQKQRDEVTLRQKEDQKGGLRGPQDIGNYSDPNSGTEVDDGKCGTESSAAVYNPLLAVDTSPIVQKSSVSAGKDGAQNVSVELEMVELKSYAAAVVKVGATGNSSRAVNDPLYAAVLSLVASISARYSGYIGTYKGVETYLNTTISQLSTDAVSKTKLRETETTLKRLEISFKVLDLIDNVERTVQPELKKRAMNQWVKDNSDWLNTLQAPVEVKKADENLYGSETTKVLADADECFKSLRSLEKLASALMPTKHDPPATDSAPLNKDLTAAVDDHYVYDQNYGPSIQDAMVNLLHTIL